MSDVEYEGVPWLGIAQSYNVMEFHLPSAQKVRSV